MEQSSPDFKEVSNKHSNSGLVVIIVFLVATFTSTVYLFLQNRQLAKQLSDLQDASKISSPEVSLTPTPGVIENATSSSKTFIDKENGISFQYPLDAKITSRDPDPFPVIVQVDNLSPRTGGGGGPEFEGWMVYVSETQANPKNLTLREWAKENRLFLDPVTAKEVGSTQTVPVDIKIDSLPTIKWTSSGADASNDMYLVENTKGIVLIVVHDNYGRDTKITDQIISTFKFIDSPIQFVEGTYINKKYGYELKCPTASIHKTTLVDGNGKDKPLYSEICYDGTNQLSVSVYPSTSTKLLSDFTEGASAKELKNNKWRVFLRGFDKNYFDQITSTFKFLN